MDLYGTIIRAISPIDGEVDFCESCETTLAREQVKDGKCDRCNTSN